VRASGHPAVEFVCEPSGLVERLGEHAEPGDAVLFMGAGDVNRFVDPFLESLGREAEGG
jgi:UDP-N-acetylmuramate-alanine ligase